MDTFIKHPAFEATGLFITVLLAIAIGVYVVGKFRGRAEEDRRPANEMLTNFRELHSQGDLSDDEYRTIKTVLTEKIQSELNGTGEKG